MRFQELGLEAELISAVAARGYSSPTAIQERAIPVILKGSDILAGAQTGTGKTAAFTLPMLQMLNRESSGGLCPRALILAPTRELAAQVGESVRHYGKNLRLRSAVVFGGVGIHSQISRLKRGVDILVATPGRLLDHQNRGTVNLSRVEILVLDEADRMLDMGFIHDIRRILRLLPGRRQTLFFSATYTDSVKELADRILDNPQCIEITRNKPVDTVIQSVYPVDHVKKRELLTHLVREGEWKQVLVFTRTKYGAGRLAEQLSKDGITAEAIHGNKNQAARTRALSAFKEGKVRVLVATDIASRGLDIAHLPYVVNYDLPHFPMDYIHRIGRTGRAGENGVALSLVSAEEQKYLWGIQRLLDCDIEVKMISGLTRDGGTNRDRSPRQRNLLKKRRKSGRRYARTW
ncbi:MAG: DEAD/DEAH box helicase [Spirochaetales bacterium]|nr:DEAD/DEAH box helicase [Spirochaetales bacterium]